MNQKHFFLSDKIARSYDFIPQSQRFGKSALPSRDRAEHAAFIKTKYEAAVDRAINLLEERGEQGLPVADGIYIDLEIDKNFIPASFGKQDGPNGVTIMKVSNCSDENNVDVTVYLRRDKKDWLKNKAEDYAHKNTKNGNPKYEKQLVPINDIYTTDIRTLYVSPEEFDAIPEIGCHTYELWLSHSKKNTCANIRQVLMQLNINIAADPLIFDAVDVWLIQASKQQLISLPSSLGYIEGIRPYQEPSILVNSRSASREWNDIISLDVSYSDDARNVQIGILDTGVNNAHELLREALPDERMGVAIGVTDTIDNTDHGTGMAGLALLGDLTNIIYQRDTPVIIRHVLSSVKILENGYVTPHDFYGAVIEDAIEKASSFGASILCMAITDDKSYDGIATSSSAALDESIYHQGRCDRLVVVSAGNIKPEDVDHNNYIESCKANTIKSPAQAWNALTVGAYTEKSYIRDSTYKPLAAHGGISPFSCSSYPWYKKRNKPEIVMEGGNVAYHQIFKETTHSDVSLVTTSNDLNEPLESFTATSAATGLAARLAARIKVENPGLSMLSIRGLIVHSARWTDEMKRIVNIDERMSLCGYGVPNENVAIYSNERCATYIFENTLIPYKQGKSGAVYNKLHFFDLPWPKNLLVEMGNESVKIRITLSYYVKPSPGYAGRTSRYRYPSALLHFDLKTSTETTEEFLRRRNQHEGESTTKNDSDRWAIKQQRRERGTVQSDWIECTAAELADLDKIIVYPGQGWWKERKLNNVDNSIPYSLIVSIETSATEIYSAVENAISNRIGITIAQES